MYLASWRTEFFDFVSVCAHRRCSVMGGLRFRRSFLTDTLHILRRIDDAKSDVSMMREMVENFRFYDTKVYDDNDGWRGSRTKNHRLTWYHHHDSHFVQSSFQVQADGVACDGVAQTHTVQTVTKLSLGWRSHLWQTCSPVPQRNYQPQRNRRRGFHNWKWCHLMWKPNNVLATLGSDGNSTSYEHPWCSWRWVLRTNVNFEDELTTGCPSLHHLWIGPSILHTYSEMFKFILLH